MVPDDTVDVDVDEGAMSPAEAKAAAAAQAKTHEEAMAILAGQTENSLPPQPDPNTATPPEFPIGSDPEVLADTEHAEGETDMERAENANPPVEAPTACPDCRGRGFIGGAECPKCHGSGVDPSAPPPVDENEEPTDPNV